MPDGIDISWEVEGQDDLVKSLLAAAAASEKATAALKKQGNAMRYVSGPNQKLAEYNKQFAHASKMNNAPAMADISRRIEQTQKQLAPKTVASFTKKLETAIRSTRFNTKGGISPLIGQTADLFGLEAGPAGLAFIAAEKAVEGFTEAMKVATQAGSAFGTMQAQTGSSGSATAALQNLGISSSDVAAFNDRITSDPMARAYALQTAGVQNAPGSFGDQNWGQEMLKTIKAVRAIQDPTERLRESRQLNLPEALMNLSDASFSKRIGSDADARAKVFTPQFTQQSAEAENAKARFDDANTMFWAKVTTGAVQATTKIENEYADWLMKPMHFNMNNAEGRDFFGNKTSGPKEDQFGNTVDPHTKAVIDNTKATQDLNHLMGIGQRQYGQGERVNGAIPRAYGMGSGYNLQHNLPALSRILGAWG